MLALRDRILGYLRRAPDPWRSDRVLICRSSGRERAIVQACERFRTGDRPVVVVVRGAEESSAFLRALATLPSSVRDSLREEGLGFDAEEVREALARQNPPLLVIHHRLAATASKGMTGAPALKLGRGGRRLRDAGGWSNRFAEKVVLVDDAHLLVGSSASREPSAASRRDLRALADLLSEDRLGGTSKVGFFTGTPLPCFDSQLEELLDLAGPDAAVSCAMDKPRGVFPSPCDLPEPVTYVPPSGYRYPARQPRRPAGGVLNLQLYKFST